MAFIQAPLPPQPSQFPSFNVKFKTNLCKNFMAGLGCQRGNRCHFAHGEHELRKEDDVR